MLYFPFIILIICGKQAHILVGNLIPNESRSNWDFPSSVLPYLLDRPFITINKSITLE
jgi:hypothetical protein